ITWPCDSPFGIVLAFCHVWTKSSPRRLIMKKLYAIALSAVLALVLGISSQVVAQQSPNSPSSDPMAQPQTQPAPEAQQQGAQQQGQEMPGMASDSGQTFNGKISKVSGKYCLKDSSGTTYQLDDQDKAKQFSGKNVKVTGALDSATGMIRVSSIE